MRVAAGAVVVCHDRRAVVMRLVMIVNVIVLLRLVMIVGVTVIVRLAVVLMMVMLNMFMIHVRPGSVRRSSEGNRL